MKQVKDDMILRDIRRDELVMPERRWPYLSTQAPLGRKPMPDFHKEHKSWNEKMPNTNTTEKHEERAAKMAAERRQKEASEARRKKAEETRQQRQLDVTKRVSDRLKEVAGDMKDIKRREKDDAEKRKADAAESNRERRKAFEDSMKEMRDRVEARPFLFEQVRSPQICPDLPALLPTSAELIPPISSLSRPGSTPRSSVQRTRHWTGSTRSSASKG